MIYENKVDALLMLNRYLCMHSRGENRVSFAFLFRKTKMFLWDFKAGIVA